MSLVLSLFPGIGLLDMAFEEEGFCVVRGPDLLWGGDTRRFRPPAGQFAGVIGGPPCQFYSTLAHLVRAKGHEVRFGDLIPEFARIVRQAAPAWVLMENVPGAPAPYLEDFTGSDFLLDNAWLADGDGFGMEQRRKRRFFFARADGGPIELRRWLDYAALVLPSATGTVTSGPPVDNSDGAKGRTSAETVLSTPAPGQRSSTQAVLSGRRAVPVKLGGSGKLKASVPAVTGAHSGEMRPRGGHLVTYELETACRLQGLPLDFLADAPFTVEGKRKAIGNGVPLPMGRAIARAVKAAMGMAS